MEDSSCFTTSTLLTPVLRQKSTSPLLVCVVESKQSSLLNKSLNATAELWSYEEVMVCHRTVQQVETLKHETEQDPLRYTGAESEAPSSVCGFLVDMKPPQSPLLSDVKTLLLFRMLDVK